MVWLASGFVFTGDSPERDLSLGLDPWTCPGR